MRDGAAGEFADLEATSDEGTCAGEDACAAEDEVVLADRFDEVVGLAD